MVQITGKQSPPEELLSKVRFISKYFGEIDAEKRRSIIERVEELPSDQIGIRDASLFDLQKVAGAIRVSTRAFSKGVFLRRRRVTYQITEGNKVRLEFTDVILRSGDKISQELENVQRYESGDWVRKIESLYQKCLDIQNQREQVTSLEGKLYSMQNAEEIVKLIEGTKEPAHTMNLLLLSDNYDASSAILFGAYLAIGRTADAIKIVRETARLHPKDAQLKLMQGNLYWAALCNDKGWAPGLDVGPLKQITLEILGCKYGIAAGSAEMLFKDAIRLSKDERTRKQALDQLKTLKMMDEMYGLTGEKG